MKEELNKILVCPKCKKTMKLEVFKQVKKEIVDGVLICSKCFDWFPVYKAVPRIVSSDIFNRDKFISIYKNKLKGFNLSLKRHVSIHKSTIETFDKEWSRYQNYGFKDRRYDFSRKTLINKGDLKGKLILDVGCGNGRYSLAASECGAETVIGIDLISSIDKTYSKFIDKNIWCVQADIFNLPFKDYTFDFIFSIGVLHHTQNTKEAFLKLPPLLKKGGSISCTFYPKLTFMREFTDDFIRFFTTRMPKKIVWYLSYIPSTIATLLHPIPVLKKNNRWVKLDEAIFATIVHIRPDHIICFDWWSPKIATRQTWKEVGSWFKQAKLTDIRKIEYGAVAYNGYKVK